MSITTRLFKPTIVDLIFGPSVAASTVFVSAAAGFTALAAQFVVPLTPVPITAQTFAVMIVGLSLGSTRAALAMILYVLLGLSGLPVFSSSQGGLEVLNGTGGGYIIGYVVAAWIIGALGERGFDKSFWRACVANALGTSVIFVVGMLGIARAFSEAGQEYSVPYLLEIGFAPFLVGAFVKVTLAAAAISLVWRSLLRHTSRTIENA